MSLGVSREGPLKAIPILDVYPLRDLKCIENCIGSSRVMPMQQEFRDDLFLAGDTALALSYMLVRLLQVPFEDGPVHGRVYQRQPRLNATFSGIWHCFGRF